MAENLKYLTGDQQALLFAVGRLLTGAELQFVLIAEPTKGQGSVMSNACPGCAYDMLTSAIAGAVKAAVNPACVVHEPTLQ